VTVKENKNSWGTPWARPIDLFKRMLWSVGSSRSPHASPPLKPRHQLQPSRSAIAASAVAAGGICMAAGAAQAAGRYPPRVQECMTFIREHPMRLQVGGATCMWLHLSVFGKCLRACAASVRVCVRACVHPPFGTHFRSQPAQSTPMSYEPSPALPPLLPDQFK